MKTIDHLRLLPLALLWVVGCVGCGAGPDSSEFGSVTYPTKNASINGLGVFEQLCKQAGSKCIVANRLSSRLEKVDAIILVGSSFHPPAKEARDWLEEWLAGKPGRTVVYFGRDFDAHLYYREQTLDQVAAESRPRALLDLMNERSQLDTMLLEQIPDDVFCRWFTLGIHQPRHDIQQFRGPWADGLAGQPGSWPVRVVLEPPDPAQEANKPKWPTKTTTTTTPAAPVPIGAPPTSQNANDEPVVFTSIWEPWDIGDDETWESEWEKAPEPEVLLAGADGTPLVTRLTSDRYPGSQIVTVVNGAPFLNGSLVESHFRKVAHKIIEDLQPAKRIALLPFNQYGILVSLLHEDEDEIVGLSVLTTWPMNLIVAHLALLGVLICLALFPILGRPQQLRSSSLADFGQHAESLGDMLQRTGDLNFALRTIADYYRTVRGEAVPVWVESALAETGTGHPGAGSRPAAPVAPQPAPASPTADNPAADNPPADNPPADNPPADNSATHSPAADNPTANNRAAGAPPRPNPDTDPSA